MYAEMQGERERLHVCMYNQQRKEQRETEIQRKDMLLSVCVTVIQTPKLEAAKRSEADTLVEAVVWAQKALILASRVLITAGTPGHMYLDDRQAKCLEREAQGKLDKNLGSKPPLPPICTYSRLQRQFIVTEKSQSSVGVHREQLCLYLVSICPLRGLVFP